MRVNRVFFISIFLFLAWADFAQADNISLEPAQIRASLAGGLTKSGVINVDNPSAGEIKVRVYLEDWRYSSVKEGTKEFFPKGTLELSCSRWIDFAPAEFT
ncbi:MAG: hypothetical protein WC417_07250 [Candidatus Omnitrophota bacterium]|jgi:hypothetical protein